MQPVQIPPRLGTCASTSPAADTGMAISAVSGCITLCDVLCPPLPRIRPCTTRKGYKALRRIFYFHHASHLRLYTEQKTRCGLLPRLRDYSAFSPSSYLRIPLRPRGSPLLPVCSLSATSAMTTSSCPSRPISTTDRPGHSSSPSILILPSSSSPSASRTIPAFRMAHGCESSGVIAPCNCCSFVSVAPTVR